MGKQSLQICLTLTSLLLGISGWRLNNRVAAQIVSDTTLPINSQVILNGNTFTIDLGTTVGGNLFHSLREFSVPTNTEVFFNNASTIDNIITRITGGQVSNIDGLIRANGGSNLFLINPSGIIFGANARLDIGGSFIGSTASSIKFADGTEFSATNPQSSGLLTINVPIGLQFGSSNPGSISVSGSGHNLTFQGTTFLSPFQRPIDSRGLQVKPGNTLALIGSQISLDGGLLTALKGRIEIGSISSGEVNLNPTTTGWTLSYPQMQNFSDIRFSAAALLDASGGGGNGIQLVGKKISISDGSFVFINNSDPLSAGSIVLIASDLVDFNGDNPKSIPSALLTQSVGAGNAGDIIVSASRFLLRNGGTIASDNYGEGSGGNVRVIASDSVEVAGASGTSTLSVSGLGSRTFGQGNGGDLILSAPRLRIISGAIVALITYGSGKAGNLRLNATDSVEVIGFDRFLPLENTIPSLIVSRSENGTGKGGNLTIQTSKLRVQDGGLIGVGPLAGGLGGSLTINASESIEVSGFVPGASLFSTLSSSALANQALQKIFGLPPIPSGDAGNLIINTPRLIVSNQGLVAVDNQGLGDAGDMKINAGEIVLNRGGRITAATVSGKGGNIFIDVRDDLLLRNGSEITAQSLGSGNGGNITISSPFVIALKDENSDIIATAIAGNGGKIDITTTGIFGLVTTRGILNNSISEINASSQTGIVGVVTINTPEVNPGAGLLKLPETLTDPTNQVIVSCAAAQGNSFIITGRGGLPEDPTATIRGQTIWHDLRDFSSLTEGKNATPANNQVVTKDPPSRIVEATGWVTDKQGNVTLVAALANETASTYGAKPPNCH